MVYKVCKIAPKIFLRQEIYTIFDFLTEKLLADKTKKTVFFLLLMVCMSVCFVNNFLCLLALLRKKFAAYKIAAFSRKWSKWEL